MDSQIASILMGLYSEGDSEIQKLIIDFFKRKGLEDPHSYFPEEVDSSISSGLSLAETIERSSAWLDTWAQDYLGKGTTGGSGVSKGLSEGGKKLRLSSICNPIEVINHFVKIEHGKRTAK